MGFEIKDFDELLRLEPHGPDTFVAVSPDYPWGRVFGGQAVAQALAAAAATVDDEHHVHSLHAYFIRGGTTQEPIRYEVDRIRNGRSFVTRRVVARQSGGAILNLSASFQWDEQEVDAQDVRLPADVLPPEDLEDDHELWGPMFDRRWAIDEGPGRRAAWLRMRGPGGDRVFEACALAFLSDDLATDAVRSSHPLAPDGVRAGRDQFMGASLDHVIWFHRPAPATDWQLHDFSGGGMVGGRGLSLGRIFTPDGVHVATIAQEVLMRVRRD